MVTVDGVVFDECPACGELYPAGEDCECGYCSHGATPAGETCPICGGWVGQVDDPVAELLDAADEVLTVLSGYFLPFWQADALYRLRQIVTRLQGTAGLALPAAGGGA